MIVNYADKEEQRVCIQEISIDTLPRHRRFRKKLALEVFVLQGTKQKTFHIPLDDLKKKVIRTSSITRLPIELLNLIFTYFTPNELLTTIRATNKYWNDIVQAPYLWKLLDKVSSIPLEYKYAVQKKVVERRSKGQVYIAKNRITGELGVIRRVMLEVANSEKDDGIPTSALREISYLTSLSNPYVGTVTEAQVKSGTLLLVYPYQRYNLKEYMKQFIKEEVSDDPFSIAYNMPLQTIKVIYTQWNIAI